MGVGLQFAETGKTPEVSFCRLKKGLFFEIRNCGAFCGLGKATMDTMRLCFQLLFKFPSLTSRVRSPSPAFTINKLNAVDFPQFSNYSTNGVR